MFCRVQLEIDDLHVVATSSSNHGDVMKSLCAETEKTQTLVNFKHYTTSKMLLTNL